MSSSSDRPSTPPSDAPVVATTPRRGPPPVLRESSLAILAAAIAILTMAPSIRGEFVYDDNKEIVQNHLIQDPRFLWTGLTSDVWAFHGAREKSWSNYWRPMVVLTKSACFHAFGLNPSGWHIVCIALHALASALGFFVARRIGFSMLAAGAAACLFAAHPAHVESVAWIAAIPDPLMTCYLFAAYLCFLRARRGGPRANVFFTAAVVLYLFGQLCKEAAIVFPIIILLTEFFLPREGDAPTAASASSRRGRAAAPDRAAAAGPMRLIRPVAPFFVVAAVFFVTRLFVLGQARSLPPGAPPLTDVVFSAPLLLTFYLRQMFMPIFLAPMYAVRILAWNSPSALWVVGALSVLAAALAAALILMRRNPAYRLAFVWLILPLLLPLDARVFLPEDVVHDRYLYLSSFGAMLILAQLLIDAAQRAIPADRARAAALLSGVILLTGAGVVRAWAYMPVWGSDIALWEAAIVADPGSAKSWSQLGEMYRYAGRLDDAERALARAAELNPSITDQRVATAMLLMKRGDLVKAEQELRHVLSIYPDYIVAIDQLCEVLVRQKRFDEAIAIFDEARRRMPYKRGAYTVNIAVLQKLAGRADRALSELEAAREQMSAAASTDTATLNGLYYLGELYREQNRVADARAAYEDYLRRTADSPKSEDVNTKRRLSQTILNAINASPPPP